MRPFESGIAVDDTRRFVPFFDPVDMTALFPAETTLAEVNAIAAGHGLRYPLVIATDASLAAHLAVADYAPGSARFGNYADNITGMNWQLPSGRKIRIGERVVKSTTGYDLLRFLLHSGERFGRATSYVLRLRPLGGESGVWRLDGCEASLVALVAELRRSCWSHWFDEVDAFSGPEKSTYVEICYDCMPGESGIYAEYLEDLAARHGVTTQVTLSGEPEHLPTFSLKTTTDRALSEATRCVSDLGAKVRTNLISGSLLVYTETRPPDTWVSATRIRLAEMGGHLSGLGTPPVHPDHEANWIRILENEWKTI